MYEFLVLFLLSGYHRFLEDVLFLAVLTYCQEDHLSLCDSSANNSVSSFCAPAIVSLLLRRCLSDELKC